MRIIVYNSLFFNQINYRFLKNYKLLCLVLLLLTLETTNIFAQTKSNSGELDFLEINLSQKSFEAKLEFERKKFKEASKKYLEILYHKPSDITTLYSLARCYAFLKKPELAAKALTHAIDAGLNDLSSLIYDSTWVTIKNNEKFKIVLELALRLQKERGESFYGECKIFIKGRLRQPDSYDSTKTYPLIIALHGSGGNAESYMSIRDRMGATDIFFAAPQGAYTRKLLELNSPSYSWFPLVNDRKLWEKADPLVIEYILSVIKDFKTRYRISGVYLLGHSQGGALAYLIGIQRPDVINGIICYGAQNPKEFISALEIKKASSMLPIFISHGWSDASADFNNALETKNMFIQFGYNVTFKPFDGGHWLDTQTLIEAKNWIDSIELKRGAK